MKPEQEIYQQVTDYLLSEKGVTSKKRLGLCRPWTKACLDTIDAISEKIGVKIEAEAREVIIEPGLSHSFVRLQIEGERPYLCDGTGVGKFEAYFGYEDAAPAHLQNSRPDIINFYR